MTPNKPACALSMAFGTADSFIGPSSMHPGGVNVVMMDGSVRFLKDSVNLAAWLGLGSRNGGEIVGGDAF
jgi:prepilin-type processing-associated H-X9-DG protein